MRKPIDLLEEQIRFLCKESENMTHYDLATAIMSSIKSFLEIEQLPAFLNKMDYEQIRSFAISAINEKDLRVLKWKSEGPSFNTEVTQDQARNLSLIEGTISFLSSKGYLLKTIKTNVDV